MIDTRYDFKGDCNRSPAYNTRMFLDSVPVVSDIFRDHDGNYLTTHPLAREAFMGSDGKLDAWKIYREGISSGKDAKYEFAELMRYVMLLNPTKEETGKIVSVFLDKHVPESCKHAIGRSRNGQQWYRQSLDLFGLGADV